MCVCVCRQGRGGVKHPPDDLDLIIAALIQLIFEAANAKAVFSLLFASIVAGNGLLSRLRKIVAVVDGFFVSMALEKAR